jgi:hypothetical protein
MCEIDVPVKYPVSCEKHLHVQHGLCAFRAIRMSSSKT